MYARIIPVYKQQGKRIFTFQIWQKEPEIIYDRIIPVSFNKENWNLIYKISYTVQGCETGTFAEHRYLMTRLSLQVVYLWRHVSWTAPPFILWWSNLEILFGPLHRSSPFIGELRCQAIQIEHGPYIAERTQNAVYIVRCLWLQLTGGPICVLNPFISIISFKR
jgi:hypothetical protein